MGRKDGVRYVAGEGMVDRAWEPVKCCRVGGGVVRVVVYSGKNTEGAEWAQWWLV